MNACRSDIGGTKTEQLSAVVRPGWPTPKKEKPAKCEQHSPQGSDRSGTHFVYTQISSVYLRRFKTYSSMTGGRRNSRALVTGSRWHPSVSESPGRPFSLCHSCALSITSTSHQCPITTQNTDNALLWSCKSLERPASAARKSYKYPRNIPNGFINATESRAFLIQYHLCIVCAELSSVLMEAIVCIVFD
ncbi:hypothetical protein EVAR_41357_1 [Eumeta japonica]|uniref:Uncharacterized protein n=1 Tax=Eumeta variegata TaxID=151549 RepID=A0A4C1XPL5_EUMVA|nr:hypothetical protein EVAR_41357_1 [Eumeta japonica]